MLGTVLYIPDAQAIMHMCNIFIRKQKSKSLKYVLFGISICKFHFVLSIYLSNRYVYFLSKF